MDSYGRVLQSRGVDRFFRDLGHSLLRFDFVGKIFRRTQYADGRFILEDIPLHGLQNPENLVLDLLQFSARESLTEVEGKNRKRIEEG